MSQTHRYTHHMVHTTAIHCDTPLKLNRLSSPYRWLTRTLSSPFTSRFSPQIWDMSDLKENQAHGMDSKALVDCMSTWVKSRDKTKIKDCSLKSQVLPHSRTTSVVGIFDRELLHTHTHTHTHTHILPKVR